jgi:predicted flavoprotein YhiN
MDENGRVKISIDAGKDWRKAGEMTVTINGITGPACEPIAKIFQSMGDVLVDEKTPEAFQMALDEQTERVRVR